MAPVHGSLLSVEEAAAALHVAPRTVRRWLRAGQLPGHKVGTTWVVGELRPGPAAPGRTALPRTPGQGAVLARLRQVGTQLIAVGNQVSGARPRRGAVLLAWRRPRSLQVILAIGRAHPTRGWAPHPLGTELPFWLRERAHWRPVLPLLRRYERLRQWSHPRLLGVPGVAPVLLADLDRLAQALAALAARPPSAPS